jgi:hypothetical protein
LLRCEVLEEQDARDDARGGLCVAHVDTTLFSDEVGSGYGFGEAGALENMG